MTNSIKTFYCGSYCGEDLAICEQTGEERKSDGLVFVLLEDHQAEVERLKAGIVINGPRLSFSMYTHKEFIRGFKSASKFYEERLKSVGITVKPG